MGIFNWYRTGTVSIAANSTTLTGILTSWNNQVTPGDGITFDNGGTWYEAATINSNTSITLGTAYAGATLTSVPYSIDRRSRAWNDTTSAYALASSIVASLTTVFRTTGAPSNTVGADNSLAFDAASQNFYTKSAGAWDAGTSLKGAAATVAVGTTTTGAAGSPATVANSGSATAATLNFTVPQGVIGLTGATGPTGPTGPPGGAANLSSMTANGVMVATGATAGTSTVALTAGQIVIGQTGSTPLPTTMTGDVTLSAAGVSTVGPLNYVLPSDLVSTINAAKGAVLVGWLSPAANASGRTLSNKLTEFVSVTDFGADATGVVDATSAFAAAIAALPATGGVVLMPAGRYRVTGTITSNKPVVFYGHGRDATTVICDNVTGTLFDVASGAGSKTRFSSFTVTSRSAAVTFTSATPCVCTWTAHGLLANQPIMFPYGTIPAGVMAGTTYYVVATGLSTNTFQFSLTTGGAAINTTTTGTGVTGQVLKTAGSFIRINTIRCKMDDLFMSFPYRGITLTENSYVTSLRDVEIRNPTMHAAANDSAGVYIGGAGAPDTVTMDNVLVQSDFTQSRARAAFYLNHVVTLIMRGCSGLATDFGVLIAPTTSGVLFPNFQGCYFDSCGTSAMYVAGNGSGTAVKGLKAVSTWFSQSAGGDGVSINQFSTCILDGFSFVGCYFHANSANGLAVTSSTAKNIIVSACTGAQNGTAAINLAAAVSDVIIQNNRFGPVDGFAANGTGVIIAAGASARVLIKGNNLQGNTTTIAGATSMTGGANCIDGNAGYNPVGAFTIPLTGSPFTYTAGPTQEQIYINGGTVSLIKVNTIGVFQNSNVGFVLPPYGIMEITYSVAPTVVKHVH